VNQPENTQGLKDDKVFVISNEGNPLMPCAPTKAKHLLKLGKAKVLKRFPFTIQLNFECEGKVQEINLGIDTGYGNIGFSATTEKQELISGTLILDGLTKERLEDRLKKRRSRRNRLWHRQPRWRNRVSTKKEGWLAPSVKRRYETHLNLINKIKKLLPITNIILEIAKFDIQKLENPEISGVDYQQGNLYDYQNLASYLKARQKNICPFCKNEFKSGDQKATHHIYRTSDKRRSDRPEGLVLLHKECHIGKKGIHALHKEDMFQKIKINKYEDSAFMNIIRKRFWQDIPNLKVTYGNITYVNRNALGLEKTHYNDAFVISGGKNQEKIKPVIWIQKHRNNRSFGIRRQGFAPTSRKQRYKIQSKDLVWIDKKMFVSNGSQNLGSRVKIGKKTINIKKVEKYFNFGSIVYYTKNYKDNDKDND
jgi:hypothetical protein